jgi:signal peptidase I
MVDNQEPQAPVVMQPVPDKHSDNKNSRQRENFGNMASTIAVLLIAPLIALFLTSFVFQSYQVDGPSMQTTLFNNDRLLVWKLPKTWSKITHHAYVPHRGDVVIFVERNNVLGDVDASGGKQLIKRVIGLPGERVVVQDNAVTVYNKAHPDGFSPDKTLPYGKVIKDTAANIDVTIPEGSIYVMGDNRPESMDSRSFGPVEVSNIVGKLVMRVWPINEAKIF